MYTFDTPPSPPSAEGRTAVHTAMQLMAAAGTTLLEADPDAFNSSTTFDVASGALMGAPLPDGRHVTLGLADMRLGLGAVSLSLREQTMEQASQWLEAEIGAKLKFPDWEIPQGPARAFGSLAVSDADLVAIHGWYEASSRVLEAFQPPTGDKSTVRVWPHHFDIATLITLEDAEDKEKMRSVGIGMTPGDAGIPEPYLYVTPWPYPQERSTPALPSGRWTTESWYGAVLDAQQVRSEDETQTFIKVAFDLLAKQSARDAS